MPMISFYILNTLQTQQWLHFICRLLEKIYLRRHTTLVYMHSIESAQGLDELLWTYRDNSFVPHGLYSEHAREAHFLSPQNVDHCPIIISDGALPKPLPEILLNLKHPTPSCYKEFKRVIEVVYSHNGVQENARQRFSDYRNQGYIPEIIKIP